MKNLIYWSLSLSLTLVATPTLAFCPSTIQLWLPVKSFTFTSADHRSQGGQCQSEVTEWSWYETWPTPLAIQKPVSFACRSNTFAKAVGQFFVSAEVSYAIVEDCPKFGCKSKLGTHYLCKVQGINADHF